MHRWLILPIALSYVPLGPVSAQTDGTDAAATREVYVTVLRDPRLTGRSAQKPDVLVTRHSDDPSWLWTMPDLPPEARASLAQRLPALERGTGNPHLAPDSGLEGELPTAKTLLAVAELEAEIQVGHDASGRKIKNIQNDRLIRDRYRRPRAHHPQLKFAFIADLIPLQYGGQ